MKWVALAFVSSVRSFSRAACISVDFRTCFSLVCAIGHDDFVAFAFEAVLAWLLLGAVYVYWRQWTPLAVHCLCVALSLYLLRGNPDVMTQAQHFAIAPLGRSCWAAILISFPVSLVLLAFSTVFRRRIEPLASRLG